jgi:hypothetical protein
LPSSSTHYADFIVALKQARDGTYKKASATIKVKAFASNDAFGDPRNVDSDSIKLTCVPAP